MNVYWLQSFLMSHTIPSPLDTPDKLITFRECENSDTVLTCQPASPYLCEVMPPSNVIRKNERGQSPISPAPAGLICNPFFNLSHVFDHTSELGRERLSER